MTVKTMAEVLAEHHMSRLNEGGWMCASFACSAKVNDMDDAMEHQAAALSAAGYGLVADAKREALEEAADDAALRLAGHSGISITRLRSRAAGMRQG